MKLATLIDGTRDGKLAVVSRDLLRAMPVPQIARRLQDALDDWPTIAPKLETAYKSLNAKSEGIPFNPIACMSPLPRAFHWVDGSAYLNHVELVRKARGATMPPEFLVDPLMYQGNSGRFLGPREPILIADEAWGADMEGEVAVITDDVPMQVSPNAARKHIRLLMLVNDVSLRNLIPQELGKQFGFLQSKPGPSFSPVAVTPDELGDVWDGAKLSLPLVVHINGKLVGRANAGVDLQFDFGQLIAHDAKTRPLPAGSIIGSGTISNRDRAVGWSCLAEQRMIETIDQGKPVTPFLKFGDVVRIEMFDAAGQSIFGAIEQTVTPFARSES
jgi:fumarylacetoacetate (FAA) hydrolase